MGFEPTRASAFGCSSYAQDGRCYCSTMRAHTSATDQRPLLKFGVSHVRPTNGGFDGTSSIVSGSNAGEMAKVDVDFYFKKQLYNELNAASVGARDSMPAQYCNRVKALLRGHVGKENQAQVEVGWWRGACPPPHSLQAFPVGFWAWAGDGQTPNASGCRAAVSEV
jgi:hypothetical protein